MDFPRVIKKKMKENIKLKPLLISVIAIAGIFTAICALVYAVPIGKAYLSEQIGIDKCIDSGGAWDYEKKTCRR